ncbi:MAG: hypothetical protein DHS20C13_23890 [Thermodesulfobacteriota bacterium]|nr:MAG: hypothetical protein DHS20C13_23890 [Thermodesulfobacteriota bacterium]
MQALWVLKSQILTENPFFNIFNNFSFIKKERGLKKGASFIGIFVIFFNWLGILEKLKFSYIVHRSYLYNNLVLPRIYT